MSDMVFCDGPCRRSFHVVCLDVDDDVLSKEKWFCEDCERGEHEYVSVFVERVGG